MERTFEIIPNYVDTLLMYDNPVNREAFGKLSSEFASKYEFDEDGLCPVEFEFYDGIAFATDGSGLFLMYSKMDCIKASPRKQREIVEYNGIEDSINQFDVALKFGKLDCDPKRNGLQYVKATKNKTDLQVETYILMAGDLFEKIYNLSDDYMDYQRVVRIIRKLAEEFENELNWKGDEKETRDYITELEKFEEKALKMLEKEININNKWD